MSETLGTYLVFLALGGCPFLVIAISFFIAGMVVLGTALALMIRPGPGT